jgi:hypothetical protein
MYYLGASLLLTIITLPLYKANRLISRKFGRGCKAAGWGSVNPHLTAGRPPNDVTDIFRLQKQQHPDNVLQPFHPDADPPCLRVDAITMTNPELRRQVINIYKGICSASCISFVLPFRH